MEQILTNPCVQQVLNAGVFVVEGKIRSQNRAALNAAVKKDIIRHLKQDRFSPDIFFNPSHEEAAIQRHNEAALRARSVLSSVLA